jgi:hypothetical protein
MEFVVKSKRIGLVGHIEYLWKSEKYTQNFGQKALSTTWKSQVLVGG